MSAVGTPSRLRTWQRRMEEAKRKHRPKLKDWGRDGFAREGSTGRSNAFEKFAETNPGFVDILPGSDEQLNPSDMTRVHRYRYDDLSYEEFVAKYERPGLPVIIAGIPQQNGWSATSNWTLDKLRGLYGERMFKCGEDDDGYKVKVKLKYFLKYAGQNSDDSPLYVFDSNFDTDTSSKKLLEDFNVSRRYFPDDLFALVGEKRRPPYRWWLLGPKRSGTMVHIDPLGTSAWNTVVVGRKRWALFPPGTPKDTAKCLEVVRKGEDDEAINYFLDFLPRMRAKYGAALGLLEFTLLPGDTVFIPGGWWHGVLNLDDTVAITQNFCSRHNFDRVWRRTRAGRRKMAIKWRRLLQEENDQYPGLADRAHQLDDEDGFDITVSSKRRKKERVKV